MSEDDTKEFTIKMFFFVVFFTRKVEKYSLWPNNFKGASSNVQFFRLQYKKILLANVDIDLARAFKSAALTSLSSEPCAQICNL